MAPCRATSRSDWVTCCAEARNTLLPTSNAPIHHVSVRSLQDIIDRSPSLVRCPPSDALAQRPHSSAVCAMTAAIQGPDTRVPLCVRIPMPHEIIVVTGTVGVTNVHAVSESVEVVVQRHRRHAYFCLILRYARSHVHSFECNW